MLATSQPHVTSQSSIRDNHARGTVGDFLRDRIGAGSELSFVSAYLTIYAHDALRQELEDISGLRLLFGEPQFISTLDPERTAKKSFRIEEEAIQLVNRLQQKPIARACADRIRENVEIRSIRQSNLLPGKMYHIANQGVEEAILGSSNFTLRGLGMAALGTTSN